METTVEQLLSQLQSPDNTTRKQAEANYQSQPLVKRCQTLVSVLCQNTRDLSNSDYVASLNFTALLLRHEIETSSKHQSTASDVPMLQAFVTAERAEEILQLRLRLLYLLSQPQFADESLRRSCSSLAAVLVAELDKLSKAAGGAGSSHADVFEPEKEFCQRALMSDNHQVNVNILEGIFRLLREAPLLMLSSGGSSLIAPVVSALVSTIRMPEADSTATPVNQPRPAAAAALCSLFLHIATLPKARKTLRPQLESVMPAFLTAVTDAYSKPETNESSNASQTLISDFIQLCGTWPRLLEPQLESLMQALLAIYAATADNNNAPGNNSERHLLAMEALVTLCETDAALVKRRCAHLLEPTITKLVQVIATQIEDDETWYEINANDESFDAGEDVAVAEESLRRLLLSFTGKTRRMGNLWALVKQYAAQMSQNGTDWRLRHASLILLGCASEGLHAEMESDMAEILPFVLSRLTDDEHARVRYIACTTLSDFCIDFNSLIASEFPQLVLTALMQSFSSETVVRVKVAAIDALDDFLDEESLQTYPPAALDQLLTAFYSGFQQSVPHVVTERSQRIVMESCLQCISSLAEHCKQLFARYYDLYMPSLKQLIESIGAVQQSNSNDFNRLRGRAFMAATYCLVSGGGKTPQTTADAHFILAAMNDRLQWEQSRATANSRGAESKSKDDAGADMTSYALYCLDQLCSLLGEQFQPYLSSFMPALLQQARSSLDEAESKPKIDAGPSSNATPATLPTSAAAAQSRVAQSDEREDQAQAIKVLATIASACHFDAFRPYLSDVCDIILKYSTGATLSCMSSDEQVQWRALDALPKLAACARRAYGPSTDRYVDFCRSSLTHIIQVLQHAPLYYTISVDPPTYDPNSTIGVAYEALGHMIETIGLDENVFNNEQQFLGYICRSVQRTLSVCTRIMREVCDAVNESSADDAVSELMEDLATCIFDSFIDFHCSFFGTFGGVPNVLEMWLRAGETAENAKGSAAGDSSAVSLPLMLREISSFAEFRRQYALKLFATVVSFCFDSKKRNVSPTNDVPKHNAVDDDGKPRLAVIAQQFCPLVYAVLQKFDAKISAATEVDGVHRGGSGRHKARDDDDEEDDEADATADGEDTVQTALFCVGTLAKAQTATSLFVPDDQNGFLQQILPILYNIVSHGNPHASKNASKKKKGHGRRKNASAAKQIVSATLYDSTVTALTAIIEHFPQIILALHKNDNDNNNTAVESSAKYAGICRAWLDLLPLRAARAVRLQDYQECCEVYGYLGDLLTKTDNSLSSSPVSGLFAHEYALFEQIIAQKLVAAMNGGSLTTKFPAATDVVAGTNSKFGMSANAPICASLTAGGSSERRDANCTGDEGSKAKDADVCEELQPRMLSIVQAIKDFTTRNAPELGMNSHSLLQVLEGAAVSST